jgi:FKBP-type peptidyl-prolyl cis-trans isomerase
MRIINSIILLISFLLVGCLDVDNTSATQLTKELLAIDEYINKGTYLHVTDGNNQGVRIAVTEFGSGPPPHEGQVVQATLVGHLLSDWSVFETVTFNDRVELISVIGLRAAVESLPEGTKATIFIASNYGFGPAGTTNVPGNATLTYEVILEKVIKTSAELIQFKSDTTAIHKYLKNSAINANLHTAGIWYTFDKTGTGKSPNVYDFVSFEYKGSMLSTGAVFQESEIKKQIVFGLIDGLKIGFPIMKWATL